MEPLKGKDSKKICNRQPGATIMTMIAGAVDAGVPAKWATGDEFMAPTRGCAPALVPGGICVGYRL